MSGSLLLWIALALLLFWGVGLYNRLMRIRARGLGALGSVEKHSLEFTKLVLTHAESNRVGRSNFANVLSDSSGPDWTSLLDALQGLDYALKVVRSAPLVTPPLVELANAMAAVRQAWLDLCAVPADLAGPIVPHEMQVQLDSIIARIEASRNGYNQILLNYNAALKQFPARLIVRLMGFSPGSML